MLEFHSCRSSDGKKGEKQHLLSQLSDVLHIVEDVWKKKKEKRFTWTILHVFPAHGRTATGDSSPENANAKPQSAPFYQAQTNHNLPKAEMVSFLHFSLV